VRQEVASEETAPLEACTACGRLLPPGHICDLGVRNAERDAEVLRLRADNHVLQAQALEHEAELVILRARYAAAMDSLVDKALARHVPGERLSA
jgi:hypothetical protein